MTTIDSTPLPNDDQNPSSVQSSIRPSLIEAAELYRNQGLKPLPLDGKKPKLKNWPAVSLTHEEFTSMLADSTDPGMGIQMGSISGIVDVEWDDPEGEEAFRKHIGDVKGPAFSSRRGEHHLFKWDERLASCGAKATIDGLEFHLGGSGKGAQTAWPPTAGREWLPGRLFGEIELPELPDEVIERLVQESKGTASGHAASKGDWPEVSAEDLEYRMSHLRKLDDAVEGANGSAAFMTACHRIARHYLNEEQSRELVDMWNDEKCSPPFTPTEVDHKWADAKAAANNEFPWLFEGPDAFGFDDLPLVEGNAGSSSKNRVAAEDLLEEIIRSQRVDPSQHSIGRLVGFGDVRYRRMSSAELSSNDFIVEYLIPGAMVAGQPLILAAPEKCMKTTMFVDAAIALASEGRFLGQFEVARRCNVAMLSGESGMATLKETAVRVSQAAKVDLATLDNLVWYGDLPDFQSAEHLLAVNELIDEDSIDVLFIDPMYLCLDGVDAGNLMIQGQKLRPMARLCQAKGVTLAVAHHTKNLGQDAYRSLTLSDIAWAGFKQFFRQWWLVNRREAYQEGTGEHRLWLGFGGSAGHSALWGVDIAEGVRSKFDGISDRYWSVEILDSSEAKSKASERRTGEDATSILRYLQTAPGGDTLSGIRDGADVKNANRAKRAIDSLLRRFEIETCQVAKGNNRSYAGYRKCD